MEKQDQERNQSPAPPASQQQDREKEDQPRPKRQIDHDDPVEEASDESFPASDPPSSY